MISAILDEVWILNVDVVTLSKEIFHFFKL